VHFALSLAWIALTITGTIPHHTVTLDHTGDVGLSGKVILTTSDSTTPATSRSSARFSAFPQSPIPRAREDSFTVVFYASKIFGRKTAQLSETLRESVYSGPASENRLRNIAG